MRECPVACRRCRMVRSTFGASRSADEQVETTRRRYCAVGMGCDKDEDLTFAVTSLRALLTPCCSPLGSR
jgi:hypothetical protein